MNPQELQILEDTGLITIVRYRSKKETDFILLLGPAPPALPRPVMIERAVDNDNGYLICLHTHKRGKWYALDVYENRRR